MLIKIKNLIPSDRMRNTDDLYRKWQEIRAGESKAVILDLRTEVCAGSTGIGVFRRLS